MKTFALAVLLAAFAPGVYADPETHRWFGHGAEWYQHPCGLKTFARYGGTDTHEVRQKYKLTREHPERCSELFPLSAR
jgi:hypothetical protein